MIIIKEIFKSKEKKVMTKRELVLWNIKRFIFPLFPISLLAVFIIRLVANSMGEENLLLHSNFFVNFMTVLFLILPFIETVLKPIIAWNYFHKYFPIKINLDKPIDYYKTEESYKFFNTLISLDEEYFNKLNLDEDQKDHLLRLINITKRIEKLENIKGDYDFYINKKK